MSIYDIVTGSPGILTYMDESRGNQHSSTEMLAGKEDLGWDFDPANLLGHHWEAGSWIDEEERSESVLPSRRWIFEGHTED